MNGFIVLQDNVVGRVAVDLWVGCLVAHVLGDERKRDLGFVEGNFVENSIVATVGKCIEDDGEVVIRVGLFPVMSALQQ